MHGYFRRTSNDRLGAFFLAFIEPDLFENTTPIYLISLLWKLRLGRVGVRVALFSRRI